MSRPGKITVFEQTPIMLKALLYNFDVGSSAVKSEHIEWLTVNAKIFQQRRGNIIISTIGLASRTGSDRYNMNLSKMRGDAVQQEVFFLNPRYLHLRDTTEVYVGERAANPIGIQDNVEDERWRGVFLQIWDRPMPKYTPPPKFVARRKFVKILLKEEMKTVGGGEPGEKSYRAAQAIRRESGLAGGTLNEKTQMVDETFQLVRVTITRTSSAHGVPIVASYETEFLDVHYEWGPWTYVNGKAPQVTFVRKPDVSLQGKNAKDFVRTMDLFEAEDWLTRPLWAYDHY